LQLIELSQSLRAILLFAMLLALMATGMLISIALGLWVLTYLFVLSSVDPKMVGLNCLRASTSSRSWPFPSLFLPEIS
jgi:C4-dicarboxylate transporter DctM subunit